ncbi:hypothetical protein TNCV_5116861 [Trichonephila clavipes]|nr:hypothetical protein TNCV_5116861 [Trichonephila clavipes]
MHLAYGATDCNPLTPQRCYEQRYLRKLTPKYTLFERFYRRLSDRGFSVVDAQEREWSKNAIQHGNCAGSGTKRSRNQNTDYCQSCRDFPYDRLVVE